MGLSLEVGMVADLLENDPEGAEGIQEEFALLSSYLTAVGLKPHIEPFEMEVWSCAMRGYSGVHYLRRIAAHLYFERRLPEPGDRDAAHDPVLSRYYSEYDRSGRRPFGSFDHLIVHSDAEGYYIPQDFAQVLHPGASYPIAGGSVGSCHRLRDECQRLAMALELPLDIDPEDELVWKAADSQGVGDCTWKRYGVESFVCLRLHHAANHAIKTGAAIVFS